MIHTLTRWSAKIFEHFGWKVLSLATALVIWALVASEPEMATFTAVRLEYSHLPEDLEIASEPVGTVVLELKGPSGELRRVTDTLHPEVVLDVTGVGPGMRTYAIGDGNVRLPRGVRLVRAIPSEVHLQFDTHLDRTVPVLVRWVGEPAAKYRVTPPAIGIQGPRSRVQRVTVAVTDPVDLSGVTDAAEVKVNVALDDPYVRFRGPSQVAVEVIKR